jgi:hypothetical protein
VYLRVGAGLVWISTFPDTRFDIPGFDQPQARLDRFLDPVYVSLDLRITETLVLLLTTAILATSVARARRLVSEQVYATRDDRISPAIFPPNIV